jgi:tetratricopeptide (TPR) repeat protein
MLAARKRSPPGAKLQTKILSVRERRVSAARPGHGSLMPSSLRQISVASLAALLLCAACAVPARAQDDDSDDPVRLFNRAQDVHARGDFERAVDLYDAALRLKPDFAEAEYQKGVALVSLRRPAEAEAALRRAAAIKKDWPQPQAALGLLLARDGRGAEAEPFLRRAVELDPKNAQSLAALAQIRARAGASDDALKFISRATEAEGATAAHWTLRAQIERLAGDKASAAASVERALKLDPQSADALAERAEQRAAAGDLAGAAGDLKQAIGFSPGADRERLQKRLGEFEGQGGIGDCGESSIPALEKIAASDPKNAPAHNCLGIAYRRGDPQKSLEHFAEALKLQPSDANYATGYGAALVQLRRFGEAASILRQVVSAKPDVYEAHANLATALDELKQYEAALAEYRWLAAARPDLAVLHFLVARDLDLLGEFEPALAEYETFLARADAEKNRLEIDKVNLRLPSLRRQIEQTKGSKKKKQQP